MMHEEECIDCREATGRAGTADDSLYLDDHGPLCEDCLDDRLRALGRRS